MAQTTILAAAIGGGTSTEIVLASGSTVTVALFVASGSVPGDASATVFLDTPGADSRQFDLRGGKGEVIGGPGTFRVVKDATATAVGVFYES